jgi:hypothetical protein
VDPYYWWNACEACGAEIDNQYDRWCLRCEKERHNASFDPDVGRNLLWEEGGDDAW